VEEGGQRCGGEEEAEDEEADGFAGGFLFEGGQIPAADSAEGCEIGEHEGDAGEGMGGEEFGFDGGQGDEKDEESQRDGAVADLQGDVEPVEGFFGREIFVGGKCGGVLIVEGGIGGGLHERLEYCYGTGMT
jgi:hypothetical protein